MEDLISIDASMPMIPGSKSFTKNTHLFLLFNYLQFAQLYASEVVSKYLPLFRRVTVFVDATTIQERLPTVVLPEDASTMPIDPSVLGLGEFWPEEVSFELCDSGAGWSQNVCILRFLEKAEGDPEMSPVMYMGDDNFLNFTHAELHLPKDKIWFPEIAHMKGSIENRTVWDGYKR
jgi:hypothetical protein